MNPDENTTIGEAEQYHYWLDAQRLSAEDLEQLAKRYDADERHCCEAIPNPHDD